MSPYETYLSVELRKIVSDFREAFRAKNINATGNLSAKTREVVEVQPEVTRGIILAPAYIFTADDGRAPTRNIGPGLLKKQIKIWLGAKGIPLWPGFKNQDAQAFVIARKIHETGTQRYREISKRNKILSETIPDSRIEQIIRGVAGIASANTVQAIRQLKLGQRS